MRIYERAIGLITDERSYTIREIVESPIGEALREEARNCSSKESVRKLGKVGLITGAMYATFCI